MESQVSSRGFGLLNIFSSYVLNGGTLTFLLSLHDFHISIGLPIWLLRLLRLLALLWRCIYISTVAIWPFYQRDFEWCIGSLFSLCFVPWRSSKSSRILRISKVLRILRVLRSSRNLRISRALQISSAVPPIFVSLCWALNCSPIQQSCKSFRVLSNSVKERHWLYSYCKLRLGQSQALQLAYHFVHFLVYGKGWLLLR